jgi:lycopene cyclase domain-containing protein
VTYLQFLALFLAVPIIALLLALRRDLRSLPWLAIAGICAIALAYTTPWDNLLILNGVWTYAPERVLNVALGVVPLEEYGFFVLQTILTSLFALLLWKPARSA